MPGIVKIVEGLLTAPDMVMLLRFWSVNVRSTTCPSVTVPKSMAVGLTSHSSTGATWPVPAQAIVQPPLACTEQFRVPAAAGAKRRVMLTDSPSARL